MSRKKQTKKLRKHLAAQFEDWLGERSPDELERLDVKAKHMSKPSFVVRLTPLVESAQSTAGGS